MQQEDQFISQCVSGDDKSLIFGLKKWQTRGELPLTSKTSGYPFCIIWRDKLDCQNMQSQGLGTIQTCWKWEMEV